IKLMRKTLKPGSFRLWRKRVSGKGTKHRKRFKISKD
ncbi:MAG: TIGR03643 family protein, partial [Planctomycetaceae bacterium]|nr:TIGR03643 family protein [Planctomycetaceae bacterium]